MSACLVLFGRHLVPAAVVKRVKLLASLGSEVAGTDSIGPSQTAGAAMHMIQPAFAGIQLTGNCNTCTNSSAMKTLLMGYYARYYASSDVQC